MKRGKYLLLILLIPLLSCESFLDVKSDARLVVPKTLQDAQALLDDKSRMLDRAVPGRGEDITDDYYLNETVYNGLSENMRRFYVWDYPEYFGRANDWGNAYVPIYNANLALELLNDIVRTPQNQTEWDNVYGSALFYRAFYFFKLLVVFSSAYDDNTARSDHGIVLKLDTDFNKLSVRASVMECYEQIFKDLMESLQFLPDHPVHPTRPSKGATYALLSNVYHYMGKYEKSLEFADIALSYNSELIDYNGDPELGNLTSNSTPFVKFNKETIFYAELANAVVFTQPRGVVDTNLIRQYHKDDLRSIVFFRMNSQNHHFKGNLSGENARLFGGLSTSEVILNKAESLAKLNMPKEAISTLNSLLIKRYVTGTILLNPENFDQQTALDYVRNERRKELLFRGVRFADLKRYNQEGSEIYLIRRIGNKEYMLEPNSKKWSLPLPQDIIEFTGMPQN